MPKLPNKINIIIKDFERFCETNKYQKSWNHLKIDLALRNEWKFRGLTNNEAYTFENLLLIAFRQRDKNLCLFLADLKHIDENLYQILKTLERHDFIEIPWGKVKNNKIKEDKATAETVKLFFEKSRKEIGKNDK